MSGHGSCGSAVDYQADSRHVLITSDSHADLEQCESIWNFVEFCGWAVENPQKMPLLEGVGPVPVGGFAGL